MRNNFKFLVIALVAFVIGMSVNNFAVSDVPTTFKVAVIDAQKVILSSSQVKALQEDQKKKAQELSKFIETAKTAINKESDVKKKQALEEKYNKEFQTKRNAMVKSYETKSLEIEKNISSVIDENAKSNGYSLVLAKGAVLSGGTDITEDIIKKVK
jgi:outer membrane protein